MKELNDPSNGVDLETRHGKNRTTRSMVIAVVAALLAGALTGWGLALTSSGRFDRAPEGQGPGGVVGFDVFETRGGRSRYVASVFTLTRPGESFGVSTADPDLRTSFVVCEDDEDSVNPCGPTGPATDEYGAVSVLWDAEGNVVGDWTPESERLAEE